MALNLSNLPNVSSVDSWEDLRKWVSQALQSIAQSFNGNISFNNNLDVDGPHSVVFPSAGTPVSVIHSLGRVPAGFIVINQNASFDIYQPPVAQYPWSSTQVWLETGGGSGTAIVYFL
jgi:hypothetical protein